MRMSRSSSDRPRLVGNFLGLSQSQIVFHGQAEQLARILPVLANLEEPMLVAGDLNMVPWSHALRTLSRATGTNRAGAVFPTFRKLGAPLPIDHVYAPGGGQATPRPLLGSDHNGVLAEVFVFDP